jgi:hypothetical protein
MIEDNALIPIHKVTESMLKPHYFNDSKQCSGCGQKNGLNMLKGMQFTNVSVKPTHHVV